MVEINVNVRFPDLPAVEGLLKKILEPVVIEAPREPEIAPVAAPAPAAAITPPKAPEPQPAPTPAPVAPTAQLADVPVMPASVVPVEAPPTEAPSFTLAQISAAGAGLLRNKPSTQPQLVALLNKYGAETVVDIKPEHFGAFAAELREMGAKI